MNETSESKKELKALTQGGGVYNPRCSSSRGATKSDMADLINNPWFKTQTNDDKTNAAQGNYDHDTQRNSVKACVPLDLTGIFSTTDLDLALVFLIAYTGSFDMLVKSPAIIVIPFVSLTPSDSGFLTTVLNGSLIGVGPAGAGPELLDDPV